MINHIIKKLKKKKVIRFNPMLDGMPSAIFETPLDVFLIEKLIGKVFIGIDGGEWIVKSWKQDHRCRLPHDGCMTLMRK